MYQYKQSGQIRTPAGGYAGGGTAGGFPDVIPNSFLSCSNNSIFFFSSSAAFFSALAFFSSVFLAVLARADACTRAKVPLT
jgi:hypothetical protein